MNIIEREPVSDFIRDQDTFVDIVDVLCSVDDKS